MRIDLIDKLIEPIDEFISKETELLPTSADKGFMPIMLDVANFSELGVFSSEKGIIAVDGGNANIILAPNISIDFVRVVAVFYKENKRIKTVKKEFFCIVKANEMDGNIFYDVEYIGDKIVELMRLSSKISTVDGENYDVDIESIAGSIRRLAEISLARSVMQEGFDMVVDGSIRVKTKYELQKMKDLIDEAKLKKSVVGFLSKTCRLIAGKSGSLNATLNELGPKSSWYYYPVFEIKNENYLGDMYFVKLNPKSKYCFKLEIAKTFDAKDYILNLSLNSSDPIFYGYSYCLIDADRNARVTNKEKDYLKALVLAKIKNKNKFQYLASNLDAHDILDNIGG